MMGISAEDLELFGNVILILEKVAANKGKWLLKS
jgi:hypothetical protein